MTILWGVHFVDLPLDIVHDVLKYMPSRDLMKYQLVSVDFDHVCRSILKGRRFLTINDGSVSHCKFDQDSSNIRETFMPDFGHVSREFDFIKSVSAVSSITTLNWNDLNMTKDMGLKMATYCPKVEVLNVHGIRGCSGFVSFVTSLNSSENCVQEIISDSIEGQHLEAIFSSCPKLTRVDIDQLGDRPEIVAKYGKMWTSLTIDFNCFQKNNVINCLKQCKNLKRLSIQSTIDANDLLALSEVLSNLEAFEFIGDSKLLPLIATIKKLKAIKFRPAKNDATTRRYDCDSLMTFFRLTKDKLINLSLFDCDLNEQFFERLIVKQLFASNLNVLEIEFSSHLVGDKTIDYLSHSTKLRQFSLIQSSVTDAGFQKLLENCRKLHNIEIVFCSKLTEFNTINSLINYAKKFNSRKIFAKFNCKDLTRHKMPQNLSITPSY
ncbi:hypothetical protein HDE_02175 [Halotydeus destructor]|nr:hypothetical protein HDE_02175 [Halotydeus destructor]